MLRLAADENFNGAIVQQVIRQLPTIDLLQVQDTVIYKASDDIMLEWAANENRIVLTHDISTVPDFAYARMAEGKIMPGVIAVPQDAAIGRIAQDVLLLVQASFDGEFENSVIFLPL